MRPIRDGAEIRLEADSIDVTQEDVPSADILSAPRGMSDPQIERPPVLHTEHPDLIREHFTFAHRAGLQVAADDE